MIRLIISNNPDISLLSCFVYSWESQTQKMSSFNFHYNVNFLRNERGTLQNTQGNVWGWCQEELKGIFFFHLLSFNSSWKNLFTSLQLVKRVCQEVTKYFPEFYGYSQKGFSTFTITYFTESLNWKCHKNVETLAFFGTFI